MIFFDSRLVISVFIFLVSLGGAYGMLNTTLHDSVANPSETLHADLNEAFARHLAGAYRSDRPYQTSAPPIGKTGTCRN